MSTLNGIGTFYYGNDDRRSDGSQIATLFAVCFFMPLVPLGTHRIRKSAITGGSMTIQRVEALPLRWKQVVATYLKCWVLMPCAVLAPYLLLILLRRSGLLTGPIRRWELFAVEWGWIYVIVMATYFLGRARRS